MSSTLPVPLSVRTDMVELTQLTRGSRSRSWHDLGELRCCCDGDHLDGAMTPEGPERGEWWRCGEGSWVSEVHARGAEQSAHGEVPLLQALALSCVTHVEMKVGEQTDINLVTGNNTPFCCDRRNSGCPGTMANVILPTRSYHFELEGTDYASSSFCIETIKATLSAVRFVHQGHGNVDSRCQLVERQGLKPRRTGGQTGTRGGRTREPTSRVCDRIGDQGGKGGDQGIRANEGDDEVPDFSMVIAQQLQDLLPTIIAQVGNHTSNIQGDVRSTNVRNGRNGCSYKEFMACSPKDYDGKGGAIVYTHWIEKMESVQDMSGCGAYQNVKYTAGSFIGKALTWWNTQVQTRGREAAVGMTWEEFKVLMCKEFCPNNEMQKLETEFWCYTMFGAGHAAYTNRFHEIATEPTTIQSAVLKAGMLTDEAIRNGSLKKNIEKRGNGGELSRKENVRDDNKRSRTGRVFATITNPVRKEYMGTAPKVGPRMVTSVSARNPTTAQGACFECGGTDHYKAACPRLN
ncbi:reverse transcriptase domain-containing protein [Tanacetum coccineum]